MARIDWFGATDEELGALGFVLPPWMRQDDGRRAHLRDQCQGKASIPVEPDVPTGDHIVVGGERLPIDWPDVVTFDEPGAPHLKHGGRRRTLDEVWAAIWHWPVTISPASTVDILNLRKISTTFEIGLPKGPERRVTIYQYRDVLDIAWHARGANENTVGIDVANAVHPSAKVDALLAEMGCPPRERFKPARVSGWQPPEIYGWYPEQLDAAVALIRALDTHGIVPAQAPRSAEFTGGVIKRLSSLGPLNRGELRGHLHHAEVDVDRRGKWDTAGLDLPALCARALDPPETPKAEPLPCPVEPADANGKPRRRKRARKSAS